MAHRNRTRHRVGCHPFSSKYISIKLPQPHQTKKQGQLFYVRKEPQRCQFLTSLLKNLHHNVYLINIKELRYCQDLSSKTASIPSILSIFQSYQSKLPFWLAEALHVSTRHRQAGLFLQPRPLTPRASKTRHLQSPLRQSQRVPTASFFLASASWGGRKQEAGRAGSGSLHTHLILYHTHIPIKPTLIALPKPDFFLNVTAH